MIKKYNEIVNEKSEMNNESNDNDCEGNIKIEEQPIEMMKRVNQGKEAALKFLRSKDKTVSEISKDLKKKNFEEDEIKEVIRILAEFDLIDDDRYCERFIEEGKNKKKGRTKIKYELFDKGLGKELVLLKLEEHYSSEEEEENARLTLDKIFAGQTLDKKRLEKGYGKLRYQGYGDDVIRSTINKYKNAQKDNVEIDDFDSDI